MRVDPALENLSMATILVIDDDASIRRSLRRILELHGHQVREADNGSAALDLEARGDLDLVITDIYMPEMDGIEFLIRFRDLYPRTPVIAISGGGYAPKEFVLKDATLIGARATISKPLTVDGVLDAVQLALND
jgi:DNA-binding NtrC family response regulator